MKKNTCNIDSDMSDEEFKEINIESTFNAIGTEEMKRGVSRFKNAVRNQCNSNWEKELSDLTIN
ncbi:hypothetical protein PIROE2DRAFT_6348 [Piromyces sp. E2]|nr:hypothetical protein PIROE2DRAFT_6348 [Piromyces sp. E2]|eukprot:OUM66407.1 hypothetical protein PIROE2DRAFT_6348 [Piromyces sp. E2]